MDSKKVLSALLITIFIAGMANAAASSSSTPMSSHFKLNIYVGSNGTRIGQASNPLVYINSTNGQFTESQVGSQLSLSLLVGNYTITIMPTIKSALNTQYITNKTVTYVQLVNSQQTLNITLRALSTVYSTVDLKGLNGNTVTVNFKTLSGFKFLSKTTNSSSFNTNLPSDGMFYSNIYVTTNPTDQVSQLLSLPSSDTIDVYLNNTILKVFGSVYNKKSGAPVNSYRVIETNATSAKSFTSISFSQNQFALSAQSGTSFYIAANGFATARVTASVLVYNLVPLVSHVNVSYSLSSNMQDLSTVTHYDISGTAFPGIANSSVSNLILQSTFDSNFVNLVKNYVSQIPSNTYYSFLANSSYYNLTGSTHQVDVAIGPSLVNVYEYANYTNLKMTSGDYKNLVLKVFEAGTQYTSGAVKYTTTIHYSNSNVSVASASSPVTYSNPFKILPVSSNSMITVTFGKIQKPYFVNSNAKTYFKGMKVSTSVVNNTAKNMVVLAPMNTLFSLNMSGTLFNPLVGAFETSSPAFFNWQINGKSYTGTNLSNNNSNLTMEFSSTTSIVLMGTDYSGFQNETNITVIPLSSTMAPSINMTYTVSGKTHNVTSAETSTGFVNITVPQSTVITFQASASSLNLTYNGVKYSAPLFFAWGFPNYKSNGTTVNYQFKLPSIKAGVQNGYLNVTSAGNTVSHLVIHATVNDTTLPSTVLTVQKDGKNITSIPAAAVFVVTANYSSDKYATFNSFKFNWTFEYGNGTAIPANSQYLYIISSSSSPWNSSSWLKVQLNTTSNIHVSLKVTAKNLSSYDNVSYSTVYSGPKLLVTGIYYTGSFTQGVKKMVEVNVTNKGSEKVTNETIMVYDGTTLVGSQAYSTVIDVNQSATFYVNISVSNTGSQSLSFQAQNGLQPQFIQTKEGLTHSVSVSVSSDRVILVVVAIIAIIIVLALIYIRMTRGRFTSVRSSSKSLPSSGQQGQKKIPDQKQNQGSKQ